MTGDNPFDGFEVVSVYSRAQALDDGVLVDVTERAKGAGFKLHTVVTRSVWERCVRVPPGLEEKGQDEEGRLWDVLWMAGLAARKAQPGEQLIAFKVSVVDSQHADGSPHRQTLVPRRPRRPGGAGAHHHVPRRLLIRR